MKFHFIFFYTPPNLWIPYLEFAWYRFLLTLLAALVNKQSFYSRKK